jgi:nucleoid-associated protein YgaU
MRRSTIFLAVLLLLGLVAAALPAQSLLDNEHYKKAQALKAQSDTALASGDYDAATSLAEEAKKELALSDAYVAEMTGRYRANGWLQRGTERLAQAKADGADARGKDLYDSAVGDLDKAKAAYDGGTWDNSVGFSKRAIAALDQIPAKATTTTTVEPVAVEPVAVEPVPVEPVPVEPATPALPATYTVRLILARRDCLWRIAAYPFVYNDPLKWKVLYDANRNILTDPGNPDLILPGQVLTIPSIAGETREGAYDPDVTYPEFSGT